MILLIGPYGGVDFKRTSLFFRANIEDLQRCLLHNSMEIVDFDFGAGSETSFRCCKCNRFIPLITGSVDHVIPRTRLLSNIQLISRCDGEESMILFNMVWGMYQSVQVEKFM